MSCVFVKKKRLGEEGGPYCVSADLELRNLTKTSFAKKRAPRDLLLLLLCFLYPCLVELVEQLESLLPTFLGSASEELQVEAC